MDATIGNDVRFKRRGIKMDTREVKTSSEDALMEDAYVIDNDQSYTVHLRPHNEACDNDTWTFRLVGGGQPLCKLADKHEKAHGKPRLTISSSQPAVALNAYGLNHEVQLGGIQNQVTMRVAVDKVSGCNLCDVFKLRVDYFSCNARGHQYTRVPLALNPDED